MYRHLRESGSLDAKCCLFVADIPQVGSGGLRLMIVADVPQVSNDELRLMIVDVAVMAEVDDAACSMSSVGGVGSLRVAADAGFAMLDDERLHPLLRDVATRVRVAKKHLADECDSLSPLLLFRLVAYVSRTSSLRFSLITIEVGQSYTASVNVAVALTIRIGDPTICNVRDSWQATWADWKPV